MTPRTVIIPADTVGWEKGHWVKLTEDERRLLSRLVRHAFDVGQPQGELRDRLDRLIDKLNPEYLMGKEHLRE